MIVVLWCAVLTGGVYLSVRANRRLSTDNEGHHLPLFYGRFVVRPTLAVKIERVLSFVLICLGTVSLANIAWQRDHYALISWASLAVFLLAVTVPPLVVTVAHNRRVVTASGRRPAG